QQTRNQGLPHLHGLFNNRIRKKYLLRFSLLTKRWNQIEVSRALDETETDRFVVSLRGKRVAQCAFAVLSRMVFTREAGRRKRGFYFVVARVAGDLFDQIFLNRDIVAPGRNGKFKSITVIFLKFKTQGGQDAKRFLRRNPETRDRFDSVQTQAYRSAWCSPGINVQRIFGCDTARKFANQRHATLLRAQHTFRIGAALKAM